MGAWPKAMPRLSNPRSSRPWGLPLRAVARTWEHTYQCAPSRPPPSPLGGTALPQEEGPAQEAPDTPLLPQKPVAPRTMGRPYNLPEVTLGGHRALGKITLEPPPGPERLR